NVFSKGSALKEIFKDERFLYPEFVPERLPHRDSEIDSIVFALKPVSAGKKPENVFLVGAPGTGKTVTAKFVLKELEEYSDRAKSLYLNCFRVSTRHAALTEISNFLGNPISRRGTSSDEAFDGVLSAFKKISFTPILVFDELDQLVYSGEASKLFYDLLRVFEFTKARFGLVLISNYYEALAKLDSRVKSSLSPQPIHFQAYNPMQLKDILRERAQYAFHENGIDSEAISLAAAHAAKRGGDARIAIEVLLKAGRLAEKQNSEKLMPGHLNLVFASVEDRAMQKAAPALTEQDNLILSLLPKEGKISSGILFEKFIEKTRQEISQRRFRAFVTKLEKMNLLECEFTGKGARGRTRMVGRKS
ncbi:MAG: AAA family ATPase, partial [Candidatus Diapherotrites archaeon]|nr:AAA family ATPase [Candidatus Diapherotrites archaeon]